MQCVRNNPLEYIWEMMLEFLISLLIAAFLQCSPACQLNYVHKVRRPPRTAFRLTVIKVVPPSRYCISKPDSGSTAGCAQLTRVRTRAAHNPDILKNLDQIVSQAGLAYRIPLHIRAVAQQKMNWLLAPCNPRIAILWRHLIWSQCVSKPVHIRRWSVACPVDCHTARLQRRGALPVSCNLPDSIVECRVA
jgi:hypothetical protein